VQGDRSSLALGFRFRGNDKTKPLARAASAMRPCLARARGDDRPDSDIDIMIEVDPDAGIGVYEYVAPKLHRGTL
jgi:hypothetical protein